MSQKAKPAGTSGGHRELLVTDWKAHKTNTLQGFLSLTLPSGLVIHNCGLHQKGTARWIGLPSRQFRKGDGSTGYSPIIEFATKDAQRRFQAAALEAVDRYASEIPQ